MTRKAKREGKDPSFYLKQGAENPTVEILARMRALGKEKSFEEWKVNFNLKWWIVHLMW